jgi:hypothetical protein
MRRAQFYYWACSWNHDWAKSQKFNRIWTNGGLAATLITAANHIALLQSLTKEQVGFALYERKSLYRAHFPRGRVVQRILG